MDLKTYKICGHYGIPVNKRGKKTGPPVRIATLRFFTEHQDLIRGKGDLQKIYAKGCLS